MITYQNAMDKALDYLSGYDIPVVITLHGRFSEGWFYCYQSREYLETGEFSSQLAGNAPFIIDKDNGEIHSFGTAYPLAKYLQDYEQLKNK
ncbi:MULTISPECIES: YrhB domain-containing protein [Enterobacter]|uniref:YrhB domain-containing protein n=1 Tax=Enterobacter TaxID=547 RepID=UPI000FEBCD2D|nr:MULTISPECIES: YrhB domain-containing protein [Enterobacter]MCR1301866.1 YrhB family protein [Enterobacter sp. FL1277]MCR1306433.1 YrhB family protein [Enterobacter sp. BT1271]MCR1311799.1 YrhB family protein [Enterobacter sp. BT855]MCR1321600.1 YrhB family protein [Enterobacter sp. BT1268]MCR1326856.1 YrhB family protein [Enterobacter sp. BT1131]